MMARTFEEVNQYSKAIAALEKTCSVYLETPALADSHLVRLKPKEAQGACKQ